MKRYKLVRVVDGRFFSANTKVPYGELEYIIGEITGVSNKGIACYKELKDVETPAHLRETMNSFNDSNPIAILEVESIGRHIPKVDIRYLKGGCYEGGVNYSAVKVIKVVAEIDQLEPIEM